MWGVIPVVILSGLLNLCVFAGCCTCTDRNRQDGDSVNLHNLDSYLSKVDNETTCNRKLVLKDRELFTDINNNKKSDVKNSTKGEINNKVENVLKHKKNINIQQKQYNVIDNILDFKTQEMINNVKNEDLDDTNIEKNNVQNIDIYSNLLKFISDDYYISEELVQMLRNYHELVDKIKVISEKIDNSPKDNLDEYIKYHDFLLQKLIELPDYKFVNFDKECEFSAILMFIINKSLKSIDYKFNFDELIEDKINRFNIYNCYIGDEKNCIEKIWKNRKINIDVSQLKDFEITINRAKTEFELFKTQLNSIDNINGFCIRFISKGRGFYGYSDIITIYKKHTVNSLRANICSFLRQINRYYRIKYLVELNKILSGKGLAYNDYSSIPEKYRKIIEEKGIKDTVNDLISINNNCKKFIDKLDEILENNKKKLNLQITELNNYKSELQQLESNIWKTISKLKKRNKKN